MCRPKVNEVWLRMKAWGDWGKSPEQLWNEINNGYFQPAKQALHRRSNESYFRAIFRDLWRFWDTQKTIPDITIHLAKNRPTTKVWTVFQNLLQKWKRIWCIRIFPNLKKSDIWVVTIKFLFLIHSTHYISNS